MFARVHKRAQMFLREFLSGFLELILTDLFIKFQVAVTREATKRNICVEREYSLKYNVVYSSNANDLIVFL